MIKSNNFKDFLRFRKEFPFFVYKGVDYQYSDKGLLAQFHFNLADQFSFHPTMIIPAREFFLKENIQGERLDNLLFHIGMVELISYWKAACPPVIIIENRMLNPDQVKWWKKLYYKGLGEFFYLNSIETNETDFVEIRCTGSTPLVPFSVSLEETPIIPVGGGKDSIVTLELLYNNGKSIPMIMNPRAASVACVRGKGYFYDSIIEIQRTLDPLLLELNNKGFLNGHTPFSALLAFTSALTAIMSGRKYIALSNELSANESTVGDTMVNHQYSKSFEFETDFRWYVKNYICGDLEYFSFLRPLNELQIAKVFSTFPNYFKVFKSCNAGSKNDTWCGKCAKCLFTWIILSPFLDEQKLVAIFGKNLFDDSSLIPLLDELTGVAETKPFDCIGTIDEVNAAMVNMANRVTNDDGPALLRHYRDSIAYERSKGADIQSFLTAFNPDHFLPEEFEKILRSSLYGGTSEK